MVDRMAETYCQAHTRLASEPGFLMRAMWLH
jgi:hypothetical protein